MSWIKMRVSLPRDPRVIVIAAKLAGNREFISWLTDQMPWITETETAYHVVARPVVVAVTVTGLLQVWGVTREDGRADGEDMLLPCATLDTLDEIASVPGIGQAMSDVGWAVEEPTFEVRLPKFLRNNTPPDDLRRQKDAERKRRQRAKMSADASTDASTDAHVTVLARVEKSREEKYPTEEQNTGDAEPSPPPGGEGEKGVRPRPKADPYGDEFTSIVRPLYPKRTGDQRWEAAKSHYRAARKAGEAMDAIVSGVERYAVFCAATGKTGTELTKQAATFFGREKCWRDPWEIPPPASREGPAWKNSRAPVEPSRGAESTVLTPDEDVRKYQERLRRERAERVPF